MALRLFIVISLVSFLNLPQANAESIKRLETIVSSFSSLDEFLENRSAVNRYKIALQKYTGRKTFPCESFDDVIAEVNKLKNNVPGFSSRLWKKRKFGGNFEAVSNRDSEAIYRFQSIKRPFHAIWLAPISSNCEFKLCSEQDRMMPQRWAVALKKSQLFVLERNRKFTGGSILTVAFNDHGRRIGLVSASRLDRFHEPDILSNPRTKKKTRSSLFRLWVVRTQKSWGRLSELRKSTSKEGLYDLVQLAPKPGKGKVLTSLRNFRLFDTMAGKITARSARNCFASTSKQSLDLVVGSPPAEPGELKVSAKASIEILFNTPEQVNALLDKMQDPATADQALGSLMNQPGSPLENNLIRLLQHNPDATRREQIINVLNLLYERQNPKGKSRNPSSNKSSPIEKALKKALKDKSLPVRTLAAESLSKQGSKDPQCKAVSRPRSGELELS